METDLQAMEHAEWHANNVRHTQAKKRPLGKIHFHPQFKPRQPAISCRTVNIDAYGTRTYQAKSTSDIIDEQHKLIHRVYTQARAETTAPSSHNMMHCSSADKDVKILSLRFLTVDGDQQRPGTSHGYRPKSNTGCLRSPKAKRRPHTTTGCHGISAFHSPRAEAMTQRDELAYSNACHEVNRLIREQWQKQRPLDEGKYVRGRNPAADVSGSGRKSGGQWLSISGTGPNDKNGGLLDAFTGNLSVVSAIPDPNTGTSSDVVQPQLLSLPCRLFWDKKTCKHECFIAKHVQMCMVRKMKSRKDDFRGLRYNEEVYTIDGDTGLQIARQLRKGDRVHVGINGRESCTPVNKDMDDEEEKETKLERVPLCWADQVSQASAKIIEVKETYQHPERPNLCEFHPVIFGKQSKNDHNIDLKLQASSQLSEPAYRINSRSKKRVGRDGLEQTGIITNISFDNKHDDTGLTIEEVLQSQIAKKRVPTEHAHDYKVHPQLPSQKTLERQSSAKSDGDDQSAAGTKVKKTIDNPLVNIGDHRPSIPGRIGSAYSTGGDWNDLQITNSAPSCSTSPVDCRPSRVNSAKRSLPAKPNLHRSSAASISTHNNDSGKEFIQITQGIQSVIEGIPRPLSSSRVSSIPHIKAIRSVQDHNHIEYGSERSEEILSTRPNYSSRSVSVVQDEPASTFTPPSSRARSPDLRYTFNIPTAENFGNEDLLDEVPNNGLLNEDGRHAWAVTQPVLSDGQGSVITDDIDCDKIEEEKVQEFLAEVMEENSGED